MSALQEAGLHVRFETLTGPRAPRIKEEHCEFVVGRRESISEIAERVTQVQAAEAHIAAMYWRRLTNEEKTLLTSKFSEVGPHTIRMVSAHPADCHELMIDLINIFESAGWTVNLAAGSVEDLDFDAWNLAHTSGIRILGKYPDQTGSEVLKALVPLIKGGIGFFAGLGQKDIADIVLLIGPKGSRIALPA
jgi:hypothetical protein